MANSGVVVVHYGLIKLVSNEDEFAFVLLHELGHLKLKPFPPAIINDDGSEEIDFALYFEHERAADKFAQQKLIAAGCDGCAGYTIARKTLLAGPIDLSNPFDVVFIKRVELLAVDCKQSMPQIPGKPSPR